MNAEVIEVFEGNYIANFHKNELAHFNLEENKEIQSLEQDFKEEESSNLYLLDKQEAEFCMSGSYGIIFYKLGSKCELINQQHLLKGKSVSNACLLGRKVIAGIRNPQEKELFVIIDWK